jgi:hypothetical protein
LGITNLRRFAPANPEERGGAFPTNHEQRGITNLRRFEPANPEERGEFHGAFVMCMLYKMDY